MKSTSRLRLLSDIIPRVLVFVYFCTGIRKYGRKAHTSGLHRDINVLRNYLASRGLQKPWERSGGRTKPGPGRPPPPGVQSGLSFVITLHRPKGSRIIAQSMSV